MKKDGPKKIEILNKHGMHDNLVLEKLEAGLALTGGEIKSIRAGSASLQDSFVHFREGEAFLKNAFIAPYQEAQGYESKRDRKLLLKKAEIDYLMGKSQASSLTVIPLKMYNTRGLIKVEIGLAKGKKLFDKRADLKKKALERDIQQALRGDKLKHQQEQGR
jgi:SsrA-binding protein